MRHFSPYVNKGYSYQELLDAKAAGHQVPDQWVAVARAQEERTRTAEANEKAIADDLRAAEKAAKRRRAELLAEMTPRIDEGVAAIDEARERQVAAQAALDAARAAHRAAARAQEDAYDRLYALLRDSVGAVETGDDGNPLPGAVGIRWNGIYAGGRLIAKNWNNGHAA